MSEPEIRCLSSQVVYQNRWMSIREDRIVRSSGAEGIYGVVDKNDFAVIAAIEQQHIYLVEQYRYPVQGRYLEFPQGSWQDDATIAPEQLAAAELREETGLRAEQLTYVGEQFLAYGMCSQRYHIWLATGLTQGARELDPEEEGLVVQRVALDQFEQLIINGTIKDPSTITAYALIKMKGLLPE